MDDFIVVKVRNSLRFCEDIGRMRFFCDELQENQMTHSVAANMQSVDIKIMVLTEPLLLNH